MFCLLLGVVLKGEGWCSWVGNMVKLLDVWNCNMKGRECLWDWLCEGCSVVIFVCRLGVFRLGSNWEGCGVFSRGCLVLMVFCMEGWI